MCIAADPFTRRVEISSIVFNEDKFDDDTPSLYESTELTNVLNDNMHPYRFIWDDIENEIEARIDIPYANVDGLEFLLKVNIYRMFYLPQQVEKVYFVGQNTDLPDDENLMQFLLRVIDKWVAADILRLNILYLHGFASSGNSGTAKEIQECLPNCKVVCPDLPIASDDAVALITQTVKDNNIDLVIGTSMGGLLAMVAPVADKIVVNPSFHVSRMMFRRLEDNDSVVLPFFKQRNDGATEFELTRHIAEGYQAIEVDALVNPSVVPDRTVGIFGAEDDVVDCKEEYLSRFDNIRNFKGGHRLDKEAVEEVVIPAILQMAINNYQLKQEGNEDNICMYR